MTYVRKAGALLMVVIASGCASTGAKPKPFPGTIPVASRPSSGREPAGEPGASGAGEAPTAASIAGALEPSPGTQALATALDLRGVPYRNGGSDPSGFDCSGLVQWAFAQSGRTLPREVREQFQVGREVELDKVKPGDLLFFDTGPHGVSHVGIALDGERFVHAPKSNGVVRIESYTTTYWSRRYVGARRID